AAALQDYRVAWIVGEKSFAKGTIQTAQDFTPSAAFKIAFTDAVYYRKTGQANQLRGVEPDFSVPFRYGASGKEREEPREPDRYPNGLPNQEDIPGRVQEPRPEVEVLRQCLGRTAPDIRALAAVKKKIGYEDYQRAFAIAILGCSLHLAQHNSPLAGAD